MPGLGALYGTQPGPLLLAESIERRTVPRGGLIAGCGGAAALLRTQTQRTHNPRIRIPLRHLQAQLATRGNALRRQRHIHVRPAVALQHQDGKIVVFVLDYE